MRRQLTNLFLCPHLELKGYSGKMYLKTFLCQSGLEDRSEIQRLGGFLINLLPIATDSYFFGKKTDVVPLLTGPAAQDLIQYHPIPNNTNSFAQWCP